MRLLYDQLCFMILRPCLDEYFSSFNFRHSSLITKNTLPVWHHHSLVLTQYFSHCLCVPYLSLGVVLFFIFYFYNFLVSLNPVKKKKKTQIISLNPVKEEEEEKEKKEKNPDQKEEEAT